MKKTLKGYVMGFLCAVILLSSVVYAVDTTTLYDVVADGIKIVIDGKEFACTDVNGNVVQPMIYNGTTYIPVRAVSSAFGKAVYWDGEERTVYLGNMDGKLEQPTSFLTDVTNIAEDRYHLDTEKNIFDNYGNFYDNAIYSMSNGNTCCEMLLDKKYSTFKATVFVPKGASWEADEKYSVSIVGDGRVLFTTEEMGKTSKPIDVEVDISNVNDFKILFGKYSGVYIANAGFYQ